MSASVMSVAVAGASGRLGRLICEVVEAHPEFELAARLTSASGPDDGAQAHIFVDVTTPESSPELVERAVRRGQRVLVGTSGWSAERIEGLQRIVDEVDEAAVILVPNFSLGSVLGTALAQIAAPFFASVEVVEAHHQSKIDSPSGTAVRTAELIAASRAAAGAVPVSAPYSDQRARGELVAGVPVHSLRLSGIAAQQEVRFGGAGETLTIKHDTLSNDSYVAGVRAGLEALRTSSGLTVGLDRILGIGGVA